MKYPLLAIPFTTVLLLSACGGSSTGGDASPIATPTPTPTPTPPPAPAPTVTVSAPTSGFTNTAFTVSWSSTNATSCTSSFGGGTADTGTANVTETTAGSKIYTVSCTGAGGTADGTATTNVNNPATAEGLWNGSKGTGGTARTLAGVVTKEGGYWLVYNGVGGGTTPKGFVAGTGASTNTSPTAGTYTSTDLHEFNFEGGGATQGKNSAIYTGKSTFSGNFESILSVTTGTLDTTTNTLASIYQQDTPFNGVLPSSFPTPNNEPVNLTGSLNIVGTSVTGGSISLSPYGLLTSLGGATLSFYTVMDSLASGYSFTGSGAGFVTTGPGVSNCVGPAANLICAAAIAGAPPISYLLTSTGANTYTLELTSGDSTTHTVQTFSITNIAPPLPTITDDTFTTTYNVAYDTVPTLAAIAGVYAGESGVGNAMQTGSAALTVASDGTISAGLTGTNGCTFTGTLVTHPTGGNVYDATLTFASGSACTYTGAFTGTATYDSTAKQLTLTAVNNALDSGFLYVGVKP